MTDQEQAEQYERLRIARARRRHTREIRERAAYSLALAELYEESGDELAPGPPNTRTGAGGSESLGRKAASASHLAGAYAARASLRRDGRAACHARRSDGR